MHVLGICSCAMLTCLNDRCRRWGSLALGWCLWAYFAFHSCTDIGMYNIVQWLNSCTACVTGHSAASPPAYAFDGSVEVGLSRAVQPPVTCCFRWLVNFVQQQACNRLPPSKAQMRVAVQHARC
jgi:hypothetical protein